MVKGSDGFHVYGWMVSELHLEGPLLIAFSIVYTYIKGHAGEYTGNTAYLSSWTGWTEKTSRKHLAALVALGLIVEVRGRQGKSPFCHYVLAPDFYQVHPVKISISPGKNFPFHPVKITAEIEYNKEKINNPPLPPTLPEVVEYCRQQGFADPEGFADYYLRCQKEAGWKKKDGTAITNWKLNVQQWRRYHKNEIFTHEALPHIQATSDDLKAFLR